MKTIRKEPISICKCFGSFPEPEHLQPNTLYYNPDTQHGQHLCLCGCGSILGINAAWKITCDYPLTIEGSISHTTPGGCGSHYIITKGIANFV